MFVLSLTSARQLSRDFSTEASSQGDEAAVFGDMIKGTPRRWRKFETNVFFQSLFSFFSCFYFSSISIFYSFHLSPSYHCIVYVLLAYRHFSVAWSGGMFGGWWMGNDGEGSGSDLTEVLFWQLSGGTEKKKKEKPRNSPPVHFVASPVFVPGTFLYQSES